MGGLTIEVRALLSLELVGEACRDGACTRSLRVAEGGDVVQARPVDVHVICAATANTNAHANALSAPQPTQSCSNLTNRQQEQEQEQQQQQQQPEEEGQLEEDEA